MRKYVFIILLMAAACVSSASRQLSFSTQYDVGDTYMHVRLHGMLEIPAETVDDILLSELSGLAWDEDENILYAVSDKGTLFHLQPIITDGTLTNIHVLHAYPLQDVANQDSGSWRDSEGLAIVNGNNGKQGDSELIISFERKPRIARYTPSGKRLSKYTLPRVLKDVKNYSGSNQALEAITVHPQLGILTAPEWPLKGNKGTIVIYALDGHEWRLPHYPAPNSAVVALEALPDGSVLVLERCFVSPLQPVIISLRRVWLSTCPCDAGKDSRFKQMAVFDNTQGWLIDNFEGLTRQRGHHFFMISDDNQSSWQRTLIVYFEIVP